MAGRAVSDAYDVLGLGIVTVDDLLYVRRYPPPEAKEPVRLRLRQCGGLTGTALVAAARLGSRCGFAGALADDEMSAFVRETFRREGIDLAHLHPTARRKPIHATIIVDESARTRTIFFERDPSPYEVTDWPPASLIRASRVLFLDHEFSERGIRAARIAREAGIPVVADLERDEASGFDELCALVDHLIVGRAFAERLTGEADPSRSLSALWGRHRATVVVTCGEGGCWFADGANSGSPRHQGAFPVDVVDTTGCGDVFHGAYASALARGLGPGDRVRFASAAAAIKATQPGGQLGIPTREEIERFLRGREP